MSLPPEGTVLADKYRLEGLLGEGGMGAVFRARHVLMDTPVAVKWLRPDVIDSTDARERLLREARAVARIRHPNVVHVYDVDIHDGAPFIVMELLEGVSLADLIARESLPIARVLDILVGAMKGCAAAHEHGIIHRDIKPENIFIAHDRRHPDGVAKLLDFGVSKTIGHDSAGSITPTGTSVGTPIFMSVEQLTGAEEVDERSDVYSFGVVLYRALTGRLPFDGETFASVVIDIATKDADSPKQIRPDLPSSLDAVIMKAMARRREERYSSVDALISALRAAEETFGTTPQSVYASVLTPKPPPMPALSEASADGDVYYPRPSSKLLRSYAVYAAIGVAVTALGWTLLSDGGSEQHASQPSAANESKSGAAVARDPATLRSAESAASAAAAPETTAVDSENAGEHAPSADPAKAFAKPNPEPRVAAPVAPKLAKDEKPPAATQALPAATQALRTAPVGERALAPKAAPLAPAVAAKREAGALPATSTGLRPANSKVTDSSDLAPTPAKRGGRSGGLARDDF